MACILFAGNLFMMMPHSSPAWIDVTLGSVCVVSINTLEAATASSDLGSAGQPGMSMPETVEVPPYRVASEDRNCVTCWSAVGCDDLAKTTALRDAGATGSGNWTMDRHSEPVLCVDTTA
eukprot:TRINITY_DN937_c0_g1_i1.p1 TRINITY_DN937_c0_g1~~TRINITY_DN937_c0_g1_i1.p1  ORF type:complete len:120 (-),score=15.40 TRINITY_DN937_c0_g1_i1:2-361(-)